MNNLNIIAPICSTGYGIASYNIAKELSKKIDITLYPVSNHVEFNDEFLGKAIENQKTPKLDSSCLKIWHQDQLFEFVGKGEHIGYPIFELDKFNEVEKTSLSHCDRIFVCSQWAKEVVERNLPKFDSSKINVVPLGVDSKLFTNKESGRKNTIFFNCGKWEVRKGHDFLVEAFNKAFDVSDNVELWMMCQNPFPQVDNNYWNSLYTNSKLGNKIRLIPRMRDHKDVYNIMAQADCGVFPARAEGWNLELLEMMACGKHVIATNYSGHTEFCNKDNCKLIDTDELETANDGVWFHGQGNWVKLGNTQMEQTIEYMREIHIRKQDNNLGVNTDGIFTSNKFSWKNSVEKILDVI